MHGGAVFRGAPRKRQNSESRAAGSGELHAARTLPVNHRMARIAGALVLLVGCATHSSTTNDPAISGDSCAVFTTAASCQSDTACMWFGTGCACPPNDPSCVCSPGVCGAIDGAGSGSGSGSSTAGCACSDGGVCYEQIGGPAEQSDNGPQIECTTPSAGSGDACARITGQGTCRDSATVAGLCICDNGER